MNALIVIDIQTGLLKKKLYNRNTFITTINSAIDTNRKSGNIIIFIQHRNKFLIPGTPDWQLADVLPIEKNDIVVQKENGNAFIDTNLKAILDKKHIASVIICGLVTNGCVRSTCIGAKELGFDTALLKNGHTSWAPDAAKKINDLEHSLHEFGIRIIATQTQ